MPETTTLSIASVPARWTSRHIKSAIVHPHLRKLSIIIPCYNEAATIAVIFDKVLDVPLPHSIENNIIVANDSSKDDTRLIVGVQRVQQAKQKT